MYVTKPLSHYYRFPAAASEPPPEGPGSGVLVIEDEAVEDEARCCLGLCRTSQLYRLPFPQNKKLKVRYSTGVGENRRTYRDEVYFIPVIGQPLSSNRYYVIKADRHRGKVCTCSREEDKVRILFLSHVKEIQPIPFNYRDVYQQIEIIALNRGFKAKAVAADGIPPKFLRRKGWEIYTSTPSSYTIQEALGMNLSLRAQMPNLSFPVSMKQSPAIVVGKWYCPFMFVKERSPLKDQMKSSTFYKVTLEQFWEEIQSFEDYHGRNSVEVNANVRREIALLNGSEAVEGSMDFGDGVMWFRSLSNVGEGLGLSQVLWERMRWEEERGGWVGGENVVERVEMIEVCERTSGWKNFGCYVLVERFVFRRMDGSLALTYDFKHTNNIRIKWSDDENTIGGSSGLGRVPNVSRA